MMASCMRSLDLLLYLARDVREAGSRNGTLQSMHVGQHKRSDHITPTAE